MKNHFRNKNFLAYLFVGLGIATLFILLFWILVNTRVTARNTENTVGQIQKALDVLQTNLEADHDRQDANQGKMIECLINLFKEPGEAQTAQIQECTRPTARDEGTTLEDQEDTQSSQNPSFSASSFQSTPDNSNNQPENSQSEPTQTQNPPTPEESIVPLLDDPLLGCPVLPILGRVCI